MKIDPAILWIALGVALLLSIATVTVSILLRREKISSERGRELYQRIRSWAILVPLIIVPILLGSVALKIAAGALGLFCFNEFSRATGLFRERVVTGLVQCSIVGLTLASLSGVDGLWATAVPLLALGIVAGGLCGDRPSGYLQRVALGTLSFLLFGVCLSHLGFLSDQGNAKRVVLWLLLCISLNDVAAYLCGTLWGERKLCPNISPNKSVSGALGAVIFTSIFAALVGWLMALSIGPVPVLLAAGALCSICGTLGDLVISSVKRDVGIKDMSAALPGHGGILDRFDSLLLAAPCLYYFILWTHKFDLSPEALLALGR
jgi:phosphatidate cytidylyltransferase